MIEPDTTGRLERKDGVIALLFLLAYIALMPIELTWIPRADRIQYRAIQLGVQGVWLGLIFLAARLRGQGPDTLGFDRRPVPYIAFAAFTALAAADALIRGEMGLLVTWLFYAVAVAGLEEVLFRGYLHPRLTRLVGNRWVAVLIGGAVFGAVHQIAPTVWYGEPWHGVFSRLLGGVLGHGVFLFIYASTGNILDAVLLHAALDNMDNMLWMMLPCGAYVAARVVAAQVRRRRAGAGPQG